MQDKNYYTGAAQQLRSLFWLNIFYVAVNLVLVLVGAAVTSPILTWLTAITAFIIQLLLALAFYRMKGTDERFLQVARFSAAAACVGLCSDAVEALNAALPPVVLLVLSLAALGCSLAVAYYEYAALADLLKPVNSFAGAIWQVLWRWTLIGIVAGILAAILLYTGTLLGALLLLCDSIFLVIVRIRELYNLYCDAGLLRAWTPAIPDGPDSAV